jgi:hypothetical protein
MPIILAMQDKNVFYILRTDNNSVLLDQVYLFFIFKLNASRFICSENNNKILELDFNNNKNVKKKLIIKSKMIQNIIPLLHNQ